MNAGIRLLFLTYYFPPDLAAGSFRASALVQALLECQSRKFEIDVITTHPQRYKSFRVDAEADERRGRLRIRRIHVPRANNGMAHQAYAFCNYARQALNMTASESYDLVFATSSRLMTAALGARIARRGHTRLYLDIRDLFVDTIADVLPGPLARIAVPFFSAVERITFGSADRVNLVSQGFEPYFAARYPATKVALFSNGIDDEFVRPGMESRTTRSSPNSPLVILYAGNIGDGQGLHTIIPSLAGTLKSRVRFRVIGDGGRKRELVAALSRLDAATVEVLTPMSRADLLREYAQADVLFLHLNNHSAFLKVLPSKIFEYAATGKPILAGVGGYAARFLLQEVENAAVFPPGDVGEAVRALGRLAIEVRPREEFIAKYSRVRIMEAMARDIACYADGDSPT